MLRLKVRFFASQAANHLTIDQVCNKDLLTVDLVVGNQLQNLFSTQGDDCESQRNFEGRFNTSLSKFNALNTSVAHSDPMAALLFLDSAIDNSCNNKNNFDDDDD